jgi:plastocyanin
MRTGALAMLLSLVAVITTISPAGATNEEVTVDDSFFSPQNVTVTTGGGVSWLKGPTDLSHSVHQLKGLFDSGDPTNNEFQFDRIFSAGTFPYKCEVHGSMTGKVRSRLQLFMDPEENLPLVTWATDNSQTGGRFDVQYKVGSGEWKNWLKNTIKLEETFGVGGSPVQVVLGKTYTFRARSQKGSEDSKVSGWSPGKRYIHDVS